MRQWRWYSKLLFALLVAAFAYFVWPTPWMYFGNGMGGQVGTMVRVKRITGTPYMLHGQDGWQKIRAKRTFGELAPEPKGRTLGEKWSQGRENGQDLEPERDLDTVLATMRAEESGRTVEEELARIRAE